ncbi:MAG: GntR family transcriptional regulator [Planctomycetota bacterium]|jgi:DNA-binding LacI/PurR family transcriptional regulator
MDKDKYNQIYEFIQNGILLGEFSVGQRIPTEAELTARFGATRAIVRRAMRELTQKGLLIRRRGSGSYVRQQPSIKRQLALISQSAKGNLALISDSLAQAAHTNGFGFLLGRFLKEDIVDYLIPRAEEFCRQYVESGISGIFFIPMYLPDDKSYINQRIADMFDKAGIRVILMDRDVCNYPQRSKYDLVGIDNPHCGYTLTEHFLSVGYRRIEFITYNEYRNTSTITGRITGYREALMRHGITPEPEWIHVGDPTDLGFVESLMKDTQAEAFVCANDYVAANLMHKLLPMGVRIPDDIAIIGIDDDEWSKLLTVTLTTMRQPCDELGKAAVDLLIKRLENPELKARQINLKCDLIIRESCGTYQREKSAIHAG